MGLVTGPHARTPPHPQPVGSGHRQPAQRAGSRGWESARPRTAEPRQEAPPPGTLMPAPPHARARAVGLLTGPHARTPPHPQPVGSGPQQPAQRAGSRGWESARRQTPDTKAGGAPPRRPRATPKAPRAGEQAKQDITGAQRRGEGERKQEKTKKANNNLKRGNPSPEGAEQAKSEPRTARGKVRRTKARPGGRPAQPGQAGHAHAHTRRTRAWRPPTRKGRCRRPHETAPVHRPSPPSQDGWYRKTDASVTGSTHAKPPQRTQPKTEAGGNRQGQPHRGASNG